MGKVLGWLVGLFTFSVLVESVGIFFFAIFILALLGQGIGENSTLLAIYIIGALSASYLLPVVLSLHQQRPSLLIIIPIVTSFLFALPSSFVFNAGCKSGRQAAVWAMRAIPVVWVGETLLATSGDNLSSECKKLEDQP
jgi:ABC-type Fe3+-siderophore transport system permease subunit